MRRLTLALVLPALLAACGADSIYAPQEEVTAALHSTGEPPSITLYTVIRAKTGEGAHAGLLIDGAHRVIFDPAGTWHSRYAPERHDVHFGMTDLLLEFYIDYHARETYKVVEQKIFVTPEVAAIAMRVVQENGAVPKAFCGNAISEVLRKVPGFEGVSRSFRPGQIMRDFGAMPGVVERTITDDDADDNASVLRTQTKVALPVQ